MAANTYLIILIGSDCFGIREGRLDSIQSESELLDEKIIRLRFDAESK